MLEEHPPKTPWSPESFRSVSVFPPAMYGGLAETANPNA